MKVIFMGTPDFAVPALSNLIREHEVIAVVTQPDKPKGRGKAVTCPPVKEEAVSHNIPVYQPARVRDETFIRQLKELKPDVIVVAAFGQILPEQILNIPPYGCINIHASLLPKYRGAAPIQWAVIHGEKESGVTTMYMAKGLDTGDMIDRAVVPLSPKETGESLHDKLAQAGAGLILRTLSGLKDGTAVRTPQNDEESSYAPMLSKELGCIDWNRSARDIEQLIRGLNSWPSAYTGLDGKTLKIWDADVLDRLPGEVRLPDRTLMPGRADSVVQESGKPYRNGTVLGVTKKCFYIQTGDGILKVNEVQLQGKKRMPADSFLRGYPLEAGRLLGV